MACKRSFAEMSAIDDEVAAFEVACSKRLQVSRCEEDHLASISKIDAFKERVVARLETLSQTEGSARTGGRSALTKKLAKDTMTKLDAFSKKHKEAIKIVGRAALNKYIADTQLDKDIKKAWKKMIKPRTFTFRTSLDRMFLTCEDLVCVEPLNTKYSDGLCDIIALIDDKVDGARLFSLTAQAVYAEPVKWWSSIAPGVEWQVGNLDISSQFMRALQRKLAYEALIQIMFDVEKPEETDWIRFKIACRDGFRCMESPFVQKTDVPIIVLETFILLAKEYASLMPLRTITAHTSFTAVVCEGLAKVKEMTMKPTWTAEDEAADRVEVLLGHVRSRTIAIFGEPQLRGLSDDFHLKLLKYDAQKRSEALERLMDSSPEVLEALASPAMCAQAALLEKLAMLEGDVATHQTSLWLVYKKAYLIDYKATCEKLEVEASDTEAPEAKKPVDVVIDDEVAPANVVLGDDDVIMDMEPITGDELWAAIIAPPGPITAGAGNAIMVDAAAGAAAIGASEAVEPAASAAAMAVTDPAVGTASLAVAEPAAGAATNAVAEPAAGAVIMAVVEPAAGHVAAASS